MSQHRKLSRLGETAPSHLYKVWVIIIIWLQNDFTGSIRAALMEMSFIGDCVRHHEAAKAVATEWQYVAIVLDRLLLWVSARGVYLFKIF